MSKMFEVRAAELTSGVRGVIAKNEFMMIAPLSTLHCAYDFLRAERAAINELEIEEALTIERDLPDFTARGIKRIKLIRIS